MFRSSRLGVGCFGGFGVNEGIFGITGGIFGVKSGRIFYNPTISYHFVPFGWGLALGMGVEMVGFGAVSARFCAISSHFFAVLVRFGGFFVGGGWGVLGLGRIRLLRGGGLGLAVGEV